MMILRRPLTKPKIKNSDELGGEDCYECVSKKGGARMKRWMIAHRMAGPIYRDGAGQVSRESAQVQDWTGKEEYPRIGGNSAEEKGAAIFVNSPYPGKW